MTREEARQKAEIMLAYANGKEIEFYNDEYKTWVSINDLAFDGYVDHYRVKQEPKYRPFKDGNECFEEMKKHEPFGWVYADLLNEFNGALMQITLINNNGYRFVTDRQDRSYNDAFGVNPVYFADGTPFGIKE